MKKLLLLVMTMLACTQGTADPYSPPKVNDAIYICVTNTTIDPMRVATTYLANKNLRLYPGDSGWIILPSSAAQGNLKIVAIPLGGGETHYTDAHMLGGAKVWEWRIMNIPSNSYVSLSPVYEDVRCGPIK